MKVLSEMIRIPRNFLKCGVTGWCLEVMFTSISSVAAGDWRLMGKTSLLMFPIYGMGAFLAPIGRFVDRWVNIQPLHTHMKTSERMVRHGFLYMVLIFTVEYATGFWLRAYGMCPWDYSGRHSNIDGLIRLDFAPLWFATGLLFEQITKKRAG